MRAAVALAIAALTSSAVPASAAAPTITEIVALECHAGYERSPMPPLRAYAFTANGIIKRTSADPNTGRVSRSEVANVGAAVYARLADTIELAGFFARHHTLVEMDTDTRGDRLSAMRDGKRTIWDSERHPSEKQYETVLFAAISAASNPSLSWHRTTTNNDAFAICNIPPSPSEKLGRTPDQRR